MRMVAIIPARGGSKRIEHKNIRHFDGQPIIAYSIRAALASGCFEHVMVSTDDDEIARVAREYGAEVPFMRSAKTSDDYATTADVIREVLETYRSQGEVFDALCCIYATAPFISSERLREGARMIEENKSQAAFTCVAYSYPTQRCLVIGEDGRICMKNPEYAKARSQDLQPTYHDAGQFYFSTVEAFEENGSLWGPDTRPIVLPELEVQDLDTPTDWKLAEIKYRLLAMPGTFETNSYSFAAYPDLPESWHEWILKERNSPEVRKYMANREEISEVDHQKFVRSLPGRRDKQYYLVFDRMGHAVGSVNLERIEDTSRIDVCLERGIWIAASQRSKGHAKRLLKELYSWLGARYGGCTILTRVRPENTASVSLERSLGAKLSTDDGEYLHFELHT